MDVDFIPSVRLRTFTYAEYLRQDGEVKKWCSKNNIVVACVFNRTAGTITEFGGAVGYYSEWLVPDADDRLLFILRWAK